jgi:four helix bundle protein
MEFKGFRELESYKKARTLRINIALLTKAFPGKEQYLLTAQLVRASRSITANIAEGYGRYTYNDTKNFFIIARGSTTEVLEHCQTAFDEGYINEEVFRNCEQLCEEIYRLLNGYIAYLNKQQQGKTK